MIEQLKETPALIAAKQTRAAARARYAAAANALARGQALDAEARQNAERQEAAAAAAHAERGRQIAEQIASGTAALVLPPPGPDVSLLGAAQARAADTGAAVTLLQQAANKARTDLASAEAAVTREAEAITSAHLMSLTGKIEQVLEQLVHLGHEARGYLPDRMHSTTSTSHGGVSPAVLAALARIPPSRSELDTPVGELKAGPAEGFLRGQVLAQLTADDQHGGETKAA